MALLVAVKRVIYSHRGEIDNLVLRRAILQNLADGGNFAGRPPVGANNFSFDRLGGRIRARGLPTNPVHHAAANTSPQPPDR